MSQPTQSTVTSPPLSTAGLTTSATVSFKRYQLLAVMHGCLAIAVGLLSGIGLTYSALGEISLWPLFSMPIDMPGTTALWRAAHTGALMNGIMCIAIASSFNLINASRTNAQTIYWCMLVMVWGNIAFYLARIWGTNQGLALNSEKFGAGNIFDALSMLPALFAMVTTFYAVYLVFKKAKAEIV